MGRRRHLHFCPPLANCQARPTATADVSKKAVLLRWELAPSQPHRPGQSLRSALAGASTCCGAGPSLSQGGTRWHLSLEQSRGPRARLGCPRGHPFMAAPSLRTLHTPMAGHLPQLRSPRQLFCASQSLNSRTGKVNSVPASQLSNKTPSFLTKAICLGVRKADAVPQRAGLVGCSVRQASAQT